MTFCEEIGCLNLRYDNMLERDVCDQRYPEPESCPLIKEQIEEKKETIETVKLTFTQHGSVPMSESQYCTHQKSVWVLLFKKKCEL